MTCDIAMILEVLKARGAGARAITRDDSALTEPQQIQAAGSDTWPSPPEPAQVVIVMSLWNSETFIRCDDLFEKIVFRVNFEIVYTMYLTETFVIQAGCAERIMAVNKVSTRRKCSWCPSTTCTSGHQEQRVSREGSIASPSSTETVSL